MQLRKKTLALGLILVAGIATAKEGVQNAVVKERMDAMSVIAASTKVLGDMAGDKVAFDAARATEAAAAIAAASATVPALFEAQADDPVSEAKPEIWANWADFTAKSEALHQAAQALDTSSLEGLKAGMGVVAGACKACHSTYRL